MTILWSNNASTTVSGSITPASTSVQLAAGTGVMFPNPTSGNYYVATFYDQATKTQYEIVHVTAMAGDVATIQRAQEGTTAKNWGPGDIFANLVTAGTLAAFVQAGTGPANTSLLYVGIDTSTTPGLIIANTNPVPANLAVGMMFNILVANTTNGPVNVQLNGGTSIPLVKSDGSPLAFNDVTATMETTFVYNGVNFNNMQPNINKHPPQTVFYVNPAGNDNNTGFANTPAAAFATVQGAINAIKSRYTSQNVITIRVADGNYTGGFTDSTNYIAAWSIVGDTNNPAACVINAMNAGGVCASSSGLCQMSVMGFTFNSNGPNIQAASQLSAAWCNYTSPTGTAPGQGIVIYAGGAGASLFLYGGNQFYSGGINPQVLFGCQSSANLSLGTHSVTTNTPFTMSVLGNPNWGGACADASSSGVIGLDIAGGSYIGGSATGMRYYAALGGGISMQGQPNAFPGSIPGSYAAPGWAG